MRNGVVAGASRLIVAPLPSMTIVLAMGGSAFGPYQEARSVCPGSAASGAVSVYVVPACSRMVSSAGPPLVQPPRGAARLAAMIAARREQSGPLAAGSSA